MLDSVKRDRLKKKGYKLTSKSHKIDTKKYSYSVVSFDLFYKEHEDYWKDEL